MATPKNKLQTPNSKLQLSFEAEVSGHRTGRGALFGAWSSSGVWSLVFGVFLATAPVPRSSAQNTSSAETPSQRVSRLYTESKQNWQRHSNDVEAACQFARACFDWADVATSDAKRAAIA